MAYFLENDENYGYLAKSRDVPPIEFMGVLTATASVSQTFARVKCYKPRVDPCAQAMGVNGEMTLSTLHVLAMLEKCR